MKTRSFGNEDCAFPWQNLPVSLDSWPVEWPLFRKTKGGGFGSGALKDYRENRENGDERDNPQSAFPSAEFDALKIKKAKWEGSMLMATITGRYWWELTLKGGYVTEDYYWMEDKVRGSPDKDGHYWFSVHYAPSSTKIEGFSLQLNREMGSQDGYSWYSVRYDECGPIKEWMEEKDYNYLKRIRVEDTALFDREFAELKAANPKHPAISKIEAEMQPVLSPLLLAAPKVKVKALYAYQAPPGSTQLSFAANDILTLLKEDGLWGLCRDKSGHEGHVPSNYVSKIDLIQEEIYPPSSVINSVNLYSSLSSSSSSGSSSSQDILSEVRKLGLCIPYEEIKLEHKLGEGGFGAVFCGRWHSEEVAVKQLHLQQMTEKTLLSFRDEALMMARLRSDYLVNFKGITITPHSLVMEYMPGGSLFNALHSQAMMSWSTRHSIALDIAKGLVFLHSQKPMVVHRDLKSLNVLLTGYQRAKLADFGLTQVRAESSCPVYSQPKAGQKSVGTLPWMAPECFGLRPSYTDKSDIYAYGVVLWEIISRKIPYEAIEADEIRAAVKAGEREEIPEQTTNPKEEIPISFKKVIRFCWFQEVEKRPTAKDAIEMLGDIAISMSSPYSGSSSSNSSGSSSSHGGLPSGFISNFSSLKH